jgi:hypothetical protein
MPAKALSSSGSERGIGSVPPSKEGYLVQMRWSLVRNPNSPIGALVIVKKPIRQEVQDGQDMEKRTKVKCSDRMDRRYRRYRIGT